VHYLTDEEFQQELKLRGFHVPMLVIRTWGGNRTKGNDRNRRSSVEAWLRWAQRVPKARPREQPGFLNCFYKGVLASSPESPLRLLRKPASSAVR
jgi:hypothetical protein